MNNIEQYLDTHIQYEMKSQATNDPKILKGLRNIKSDFIYLKNEILLEDQYRSDHSMQKTNEDRNLEVIKKLYKQRKEGVSIYKGVNPELMIQEQIEANILENFLPPTIESSKVIDFLCTLNLEKTKKNFKVFQTECKNHFKVDIDPSVILLYIEN